MWRGLSVLFILLVCTAAAGQVYEWFDEHGNRHFSDQKPEGVEYRVLGDPADRLSTYAPTDATSPISKSRPADNSAADASPAASRRAKNDKARDLEAVCDDYLQKIDRIQSQLRAGYSEPRGNRLRARRSALQSAYRRDCT